MNYLTLASLLAESAPAYLIITDEPLPRGDSNHAPARTDDTEATLTNENKTPSTPETSAQNSILLLVYLLNYSFLFRPRIRPHFCFTLL